MVCSSLRISGHLPAAVVNGAGDRCENGRNSNFEGLVTLTFDPAILHTVVHHSSTSTYIPNFIQIEETFCGRTDGRTDISPLYIIIRSTFGSRPKNTNYNDAITKILQWNFV